LYVYQRLPKPWPIGTTSEANPRNLLLGRLPSREAAGEAIYDSSSAMPMELLLAFGKLRGFMVTYWEFMGSFMGFTGKRLLVN
jgi:hypothetical protein